MKAIYSRIHRLIKSDNFVAKGLVLAVLILLVAVPGVWSYFYRTDGTTDYGYGYGYGYFATGYGYGYGYGYGNGTDWANYGHTPAEESISSVSASSISTGGATINWTTDYHSTGRVEYGTTVSYGSSSTDSTYATSHSKAISGLTCSTTYHYRVVAIDVGGYEYNGSDNTFNTNSCAGGGYTPPSTPAETPTEEPAAEEGETTETGEAAETTGETTAEEAAPAPETVSEEPTTAEETVPNRPAKIDLVAEKGALDKNVSITRAVPATPAQWQVVHFLAYGSTGVSQKATAYERNRVLQDYKDSFGKLPEKATEWQDIHNIMSGKRTVNRNLDRERAAIDNFKKIYKRLPGSKDDAMADVHDWWAVHYMAYGIRMPSRNLDNERFAISVFKGIFGKYPEIGDEWNVMRAIAYSGASR